MKRYFQTDLVPGRASSDRTLVWVEPDTSTQTQQCQRDLSFRHPLYAAF